MRSCLKIKIIITNSTHTLLYVWRRQIEHLHPYFLSAGAFNFCYLASSLNTYFVGVILSSTLFLWLYYIFEITSIQKICASHVVSVSPQVKLSWWNGWVNLIGCSLLDWVLFAALLSKMLDQSLSVSAVCSWIWNGLMHYFFHAWYDVFILLFFAQYPFLLIMNRCPAAGCTCRDKDQGQRISHNSCECSISSY